MKNCSKCIIGAYDPARAPCQNCYDRYSKTEIQKAALEFVKEKHNLAKENTDEAILASIYDKMGLNQNV